MTGPRPFWIKLLSTISCLLLFLRLLSGTPYFSLAKFLVFCSAIYIGWYAWNGLHKWWFRLMALVGLLFNPLFPIGGQSFLWTIVDWGCGMLFVPWSFFDSSGGKVGRPVGKPASSKTSPSSDQERSFPEPTEEQLLNFMVGKRSKRRLAGPNSSIITIWVFPKWNALSKQLPQPIELADRKIKSQHPWRCRIFSDMVNGLWHARTVQDPALLMEGQAAENEFLGLNEIKISMSLPVANGGKVGLYGTIDGNPGNRFLRLGFNYHKEPKSFLPDFNGVIGVLMLDDVLSELLHVESIAIGASLEKPLRSDRIREYDFSSEVDEDSSDNAESLRDKCRLSYESAFNPVEDYAEETWLWKELPGSHIFENSLVTVAIKCQGNAGAFTRISKYSDLYGLELNEFELVYRESTPERISKMSGIRKNLQDLWISESPRIPPLFRFSEETVEKERREFLGKQKSIHDRARSLMHALSTAKIETSEWLSYLEIPFYLREIYDEVSEFDRPCQIGKWNINVLGAGKKRSIGVEYPKGRIVIKETKVTDDSKDSSPLGYPARKLLLEVNGGDVLEVLYHDKMYGVDYINKGKVLTHSSLTWLGGFLGPMLELKLSQEYFEARINRVRREKADWESKVGKLTNQQEVSGNAKDGEPLGT